MKEQGITNAEGVERIHELEARIRLEVDGALHRHLCCKGMDASVSEALELLEEGLAVARPTGEPLEDLRAFLAEHGLHVPVANGPLLEDGSRLRPTKLSLITFSGECKIRLPKAKRITVRESSYVIHRGIRKSSASCILV